MMVRKTGRAFSGDVHLIRYHGDHYWTTEGAVEHVVCWCEADFPFKAGRDAPVTEVLDECTCPGCRDVFALHLMATIDE